MPTLSRTAASLAVSMIAAAGCGAEQHAATAPGGSLVVSAREYEFGPKQLTVEPGTELVVRNDGAVAHNLTVVRPRPSSAKPERLAGTGPFLPGASRRLTIRLGPGRYTFVCTVPGHRQLGMSGALTVR